MKIFGWILAIIGGILSFGGLVMVTKPDFILDGVMLTTLLISIGLLVIGVLLINDKK